ncbi:MAG: MBL fold metallo-hydrolase, partial [Planctomycetes bacterium]|nr:MBL fold metallo-hydrolase [Planctomycetota bacterium]
LPPATTTNTCVVGEGRLHVVDPATPHEDEQARLLALLDEMRAEGRRVESVLLTHEHHDHVAAAASVARRFGVPIQAHPLTLARMGELPGVELRPLGGGARIPLGPGWELEAVHTPGHAPGHLVFHEGRYGSLVAGDMVSTVSSIIIDPDLGGDMAAYMESLARLRTLGARTLYPAHGPPVTAVARVLDDYVAHRRARRQAFLAALAGGPRLLEEVLPEVYADVPPEAHPLAMKSLRALATQCVDEGVALAGADGRYRAGPGPAISSRYGRETS